MRLSAIKFFSSLIYSAPKSRKGDLPGFYFSIVDSNADSITMLELRSKLKNVMLQKSPSGDLGA